MSVKRSLESTASFFKWLWAAMEKSDSDAPSGLQDDTERLSGWILFLVFVIVCLIVFLPLFIMVYNLRKASEGNEPTQVCVSSS